MLRLVGHQETRRVLRMQRQMEFVQVKQRRPIVESATDFAIDSLLVYSLRELENIVLDY